MNSRQFLHNWEPHFWRSAVSQKIIGYQECRNCLRVEWANGHIEHSWIATEEECEQKLLEARGLKRVIQDPLFELSS